MFDMVQQASFLIDSLVLLSKCSRHGSAEHVSTTCVWMSSPVTIFPTARSAADMTLCDECLPADNEYIMLLSAYRYIPLLSYAAVTANLHEQLNKSSADA